MQPLPLLSFYWLRLVVIMDHVAFEAGNLTGQGKQNLISNKPLKTIEMKSKILTLRKGKKRVGTTLYDDNIKMQNNLTNKQYILYWRVDAQQCVYIDKDNILVGQMTEKQFDSIDSPKIYGTV